MKSISPDTGKYLEHFWKEKGLASHYTRVFERTAVDVKIQPMFCDQMSVTEVCYGTNEKANVVLKSNKISFFVTKTFTFKNIILDASELIPDSDCYRENRNTSTRCCLDNDGPYPLKANITLLSGKTNDAQCEPPTYSLANTNNFLSVPWEAYNSTQDVWKKGPYAFFVMNFLRDYPKYIPTLLIDNCVFKHFWYHRYAYSFIYLDQRASKLNITGTQFQNFYFPMGLITNMQKITQRNRLFSPNLISTKLSNCKTYNSSLTDCHSLTIQDSVFQDSLFGNFTFQATNANFYSNEGIVLSLKEFGGSIMIRNNIFRRLASIKFSLVNSSGSTDSISALCSTPRYDFESNYRMSLDRQMQIVIGHESWTRTPKTSSVLSLSNVTHGITLYNNTFKNNAAQTGTALFIHNFENTQTQPIVVEQNTFTENFATEFGTSIAIIKYERDYVNLECKGVYLSKNTFTNNFGCPYVKGTVIISCMPEKPNVSFLSNLDTPRPESDLLAYLIGYFVSVNEVNNFKSVQVPPDQEIPELLVTNRFTDLQASEYDGLTAEIFSKFVTDITNNQEVINATTHPIYGTQIDTNRITSIKNTFSGNYALHSQLFLQGAYNTLVQGTTFEDNSVPIPQLLPQSKSSLVLFKKALGSVTYWKFVELTPLMVRMSNYIVIKDSTFDNNTQLLSDNLSLVFGAAITIDKHLGMSNVSLYNNTFKNNQGWTEGLYDQIKGNIGDQSIATKVKNALTNGVQGALITYNYWEYMYGVNIYEAGSIRDTFDRFYALKSGVPYIILDTCTFRNNVFNIPSQSQVITSTTWTENDRTAVIRYYTGKEAASLSAEPSNQHINQDGSFVLYARLSYTGCTFTANTIKDQRSFINPVKFYSLSLNNLIFDSNTIVDESNGYYSLRTYLYSYYENDDSRTSVSAKNLTFTNNIGKIMYLEDDNSVDQSRSTTKYQIVIEDVSIRNHSSSPDFLLHITKKQYTQLSNITAYNVSATSGFLYLNSPGTSFQADSITVNKLTSTQIGCLYAKGLTGGASLEGFFCQESSVQETEQANQNYTSKSSYEARDLSNKLTDIPLSTCFAFFDIKSLTLNDLKCVYAAFQASSSKNSQKILCLYSQSVGNLILADFSCKFGKTNEGSKDTFIGYFDTLSVVNFTSAAIESNVAGQSLVILDGEANIENSVFFNNTVYTSGSTISSKNNVALHLTDTQFKNNTCRGCDGTVNVVTGSVQAKNLTFMYNKASTAGAIYSSLSTLEISNSIFQENIAESAASAISSEYCTVEISGSNFTNNSVTSGKSAFFFYEGTVTLKNNTFDSNKATNGPRTIEGLDATELQIKNCTFTDDDNQSLPLIKGGFIFVRNTKGSITQSSFIGGEGGFGGSIYLDLKQKTTFSISNCTFKRCKANNQGEAIYAKGIQDSVLQLQDLFVSCGTPISYKMNMKDLSAIYCYQVSCQFTDVEMNPLYAEADTGNQIYLSKGSNYTLARVKLISDCTNIENCDRIESSALRVEEVLDLYVEDSVFQGWGSKKDSLGGAIKFEFPSSKVKDKVAAYTFKSCTWNSNEAKNGGAIYAIGVMNVTLYGANFNSNQALEQGGAIYWDAGSRNSSFSVKGVSSFTNNSAQSGGGYYFKARKVECGTSSCIFTNNQAKYGPEKASYPVYVLLVDNPDPSIYTNYVNETKTSLGITSRLLESSSGDLKRLLADSNEYASGQNIEPPMVLKLYDEFGQHVTTDNSSKVTVNAYSAYGKILKVNGNPFETINGYSILFPLKVYATPGSTVEFKFNLSSFNPANQGRNASEFTSLYTPSSLKLSLRECIKGERLADDSTCIACEAGTYTTVYNSSQECKSCPTGAICLGYDKFGPAEDYFKLSYSKNTPIECINDEACRGAVVDKSEVASLYCAEPKEGDPTFCYTGWCEIGYRGNLCADCQDGYAYRSTDTRTCARCQNNPNYYIITILIGIGGIIYIVFMIKTALKEDKNDEVKNHVKQPDAISEKADKFEEKAHSPGLEPSSSIKSIELLHKNNSRKESNENSPEKRYLIDENSPDKHHNHHSVSKIREDSIKENNGILKKKSVEGTKTDIPKDEKEELPFTSIYMKIFTNYVQIVTIIGTFDFEWPEELTGIFSSSEKVTKSTSDVISIDCLLRQPLFQVSGISSFYAKLLVMALSPAALGVIIVIVWILVYLIKYRSNFSAKKNQLRTNIITSIVVSFFILHPNIVQISIQSFKCIQLGDTIEEVYVDALLDEQCWSSTHVKWVLMIGLPSLVVWGLGIPFGAFFVLRHYRRKLHLKSIQAKFGFLYQGFYQRTYYWEFIIFYRKLVLIIISIFMAQYSTNIQGALVIGVASISYIIQNRFKPFLTDTLNELEKRSLIASAITVYCGLFYLTNDLGTGMKIVFFVGIILANLYFLIFFVVEFIRGKAKELLKIPIIKRFFGRWLQALANFKLKLKRTKVIKKTDLPVSDVLNMDEIHLSNKEIEEKNQKTQGEEHQLTEHIDSPRAEGLISPKKGPGKLAKLLRDLWKQGKLKLDKRRSLSQDRSATIERSPPKTSLSKNFGGYMFEKFGEDQQASLERPQAKTSPGKSIKKYMFGKLDGEINENQTVEMRQYKNNNNGEESLFKLFNALNGENTNRKVDLEDNKLQEKAGDEEVEEDDEGIFKLDE